MCNSDGVIFNTDEVAKVDGAVIGDLKRAALAAPAGTVRLCLHRSTGDAVQEMIIVHRKGAYVRPHKHEGETESFHIIDGAMLVVLFDDDGNEIDRFEMGERPAGGCFVCRLEKGRWHTMIPLTDTVVFLETTAGPFRGAEHNTFADWAPDPGDTAGVDRFMKSLRA